MIKENCQQLNPRVLIEKIDILARKTQLNQLIELILVYINVWIFFFFKVKHCRHSPQWKKNNLTVKIII